MVWLQSPPWGRWALAFLMVATAIWLELRPESSVEHPFATIEISRGDSIGPDNTEMLRVPEGLLEPLEAGAVATRDIAPGAPVLASDVDDDRGVPEGWWIVTLEVPATGRPGDPVRVVVIDTGLVAEGFIAARPTLDPLGGAPGAVALPADEAAQVAAAAMEGRVALLISSG